MKSPHPLLDLPARTAVRLLALSFLREAAEAEGRLGNAEDTEALHDFRVGLRRLRSTLRAYTPLLEGSIRKKDRRRLRKLAAATGDSRDLEVQIEWLEKESRDLNAESTAGATWLREQLEQRKRTVDDELQDTIAADFPKQRKRLERRLSSYTVEVDPAEPDREPGFAGVVGEHVAELAAGLQMHLAAVRSVDDQEEAHQARIAGKRLRYLLEPIRDQVRDGAELVRELKGLQDLLGDMHDLEVLGAAVGAELQKLGEAADARPGLVALQEHFRARRDALYAEVEGSWLGDGAGEFFARANELGEALRTRAGEDIEIERKYLLERLPAAFRASAILEVEQGWLPGERLEERVRRVQDGEGERWYRAVKRGSGVSRVEIEEETTGEIFAVLWPLTEGRRVRKRRFRIPEGELTWEIDQFTDRELILAEVELPAEDTAVEFPEWLAPYVVREVTGEPEYLNIKLAR